MRIGACVRAGHRAGQVRQESHGDQRSVRGAAATRGTGGRRRHRTRCTRTFLRLSRPAALRLLQKMQQLQYVVEQPDSQCAYGVSAVQSKTGSMQSQEIQADGTENVPQEAADNAASPSRSQGLSPAPAVAEVARRLGAHTAYPTSLHHRAWRGRCPDSQDLLSGWHPAAMTQWNPALWSSEWVSEHAQSSGTVASPSPVAC